MGRFAAIALVLLSSGSASAAKNELGRFLKACAWGTVAGAGAGVVSLAFEDKPNDHTVNIARGASLGLYGGIAYGLFQLNDTIRPQPIEDDGYAAAITPLFDAERFDGVRAQAVFRF